MWLPGFGLLSAVTTELAGALGQETGAPAGSTRRKAPPPSSQPRSGPPAAPAVPRGRVHRFPGRAHVTVRGLREEGGAELAAALQHALGRLPRVRWAAANAALECVVVAWEAYEGEVPEADVAELVQAVLTVEEAHGRGGGPAPRHPLSREPGRWTAVSLAAEAAAIPVALATRLLRRTPLPVELASLVGVVDTQPRLRRAVERLLGERGAEVALAGLNAVAQASAGGALGLGVDVVKHALHLAELAARRDAWTAAEPDLTDRPHRAAWTPRKHPAREEPLRDGPVERYAGRAGAAAGVAFTGALAVTRRPRTAAGAALATLPKAPWLARDVFASTLGRALARRGTLVADPAVLRRLDRIDTVVLDADVLLTGRWALGELTPVDDGAPTGPLVSAAYRLFDGGEPHRVREDGPWQLGPPGQLRLRHGAPAPPEQAGGPPVLALAEDGRLRARIALVQEEAPARDALVGAARRAGLRVRIVPDAATGPAGAAAGAEGPGHTPAVPGGTAADTTGARAAADRDRLVETVRELQRGGRGVLLVSRRRAALAVADCGVGLTGRDGVPPWGADLIVGTDPARAVPLLAACGAARRVSHQGVRLAQATAGIGGTAAVAGRPERAAARSMLAVGCAGVLALGLGVRAAAAPMGLATGPAAPARPWHAMAPATVLEHTRTGPDGLTAEQAARRAEGARGTAPPPSLLRAFAAELANPLTPMLLAGAVLSATVGGLVDAVVIVGVSGVSALVGGVQRHATDRAVAQLHARSAVTAQVLRDGERTVVPAERLVVGDVVRLAGGDVVPADCRVLEATGLETDESSLTGESLPVAKAPEPVLAADPADRTSMLYEGTTVVAGRARAVVVATGPDTEAGRSAQAAREAAPPVGVERRLAQITRATMPVALGSGVALLAVNLLRGRPPRETVGTGVALAVASVPEGLPFLVSAAQLAAARRLSAQGVLVRDPRTIEALGRTDVLCFDKTGTLTEGRLALSAVAAPGSGPAPLRRLRPAHRAALAAGLRATPRPRPTRKLEHLTDRAVVAGAERAGVGRDEGTPGWLRETTLPFEPSRGFHATRGRSGRWQVLSVKGAPEEVVGRCARRAGRPLDPRARSAILRQAEGLAARGHRVLAVAERRDVRPSAANTPADGAPTAEEDVDGLDFLGFLAFRDPVRDSAAPSVRQLGDAGVQIVMITGDHPQTAESIAREIDLIDGRRVVTGAEIDALDDDALDRILPGVGVVARGTPAHKVRVVQAFQRLGRVVAMTGDGANDAPAIRLAEVGIALGERGAPAARAAADLVVTDDRLETILAALAEGRAMWASVRQALAILVGGNFGEIAYTVLGSALTGGSPLTARQLLLMNLLTDLAPAIAIALRPPRAHSRPDLLREGPEASLGAPLADEIAVRALATALGSAAGWLAGRATGRPARARTVGLVALVGTELGQTLLIGGRSPVVLAAVLGSAALMAAVVQTPGVSRFFGCTPLGPVGWGTAVLAAALGTAASAVLPPVVRRTREHLSRPGGAAARRADTGRADARPPAVQPARPPAPPKRPERSRGPAVPAGGR